MTVRPVLGLVLIWSLPRRRWWPVLWTLVAGLAIVLVSLPFVGLASYEQYVTVLRNVYDVTGQDNNMDVGSAVLRVGGGRCWPPSRSTRASRWAWSRCPACATTARPASW
ncbi:MAG: hypothetical protein U0667_07045 [Chloroflexota bacterium]